MAIDLSDGDLLRVLDNAIRLARGSTELPADWIHWTRELGKMKYHRTYMAALGGALLAKATDEQVDSLTHKKEQGARAYQLRKPAEVLARYRTDAMFDIGSVSKNPLNGSTFLNNNARIDEFSNVMPAARPAYAQFRDCMIRLNRLSAADALLALAAYLQERMSVVRLADAEARHLKRGIARAVPLDRLMRLAHLFVTEDAEGGKRGQALVAAVLDCFFPGVVLQGINSPHAGDVRVMRSGEIVLAVEVKQKAVDESVGMELAREAVAMGSFAALLVVLCTDHRPVDRERIRRASARDHGVAIAIAESVHELVHQIAVYAGGKTVQLLEQLPSRYVDRMLEHGVSERGVMRWRELVRARDVGC